jgi:hypothetical protein
MGEVTPYIPGDTAVLLHLGVFDNATPAGGVTGLTCHASIRRTSDGKWWDRVANTWDTVAFSALGDEHKIDLPEVGGGAYEETWDQAAADASAERIYVVAYAITAGVGWVGCAGEELLIPGVNVSAVAADAIGDGQLAADMDVYHAVVKLAVDETNTRDRWLVRWMKNGQSCAATITSPTIQVTNAAGADFVSEQALTRSGATPCYYYYEATNRIAAGTAYVTIASANIDGVERTCYDWQVRDSEAS